ncbi:MAG: GGDEF domain-containing protein [Acidobacteria bacterium]|nr:GGDEF domain-containing protein [Acidobacteriota bacterium]
MADKTSKDLGILDPLTGTYNMLYFREILPGEVERARRHKQALSVLVFRVAGLDQSGLAAADEILVQLARFLRENFRAVDKIVRSGEAEFLVLLPETNAKGVEGALARFHARLQQWSSGDSSLARKVRHLPLAVGHATHLGGGAFETTMDRAVSMARDEGQKSNQDPKAGE